jgi:Zn-dependent peptidase ImmA (M78 family)
MEIYEIKANEIFEKYGSTIPVDPVAIAYDNNIKITVKRLEDGIDGGISKKDNQYTIYVNSNTSDNRKRFTIAHELGHYFLHKTIKNEAAIEDESEILDKNRDDFSSLGVFAGEIEANGFAAALLMNKDEVVNAWNDYENLSYVASMFGVSTIALQNRLKHLKVIK